MFLLSDLEIFAEHLASIVDAPGRHAVLQSTDGFLDVLLDLDDLGHVRVSGEGWDRPRSGSHLTFGFEIDQTYLPPIRSSVERALSELRQPRELEG